MPAIPSPLQAHGSSAPMPTWAVTVPTVLAEAHEPVAPRQRAAGTHRNTPTTHPTACQTLVRVIGTLMQDAEWRVTAGARPVGMVIVMIEQPGGVPLRATQLVGTDRLAHVAGSAKAHRLVRGTLVQVEGNALIPHPTGRSVELFGVTDIVERCPARVFHALPVDMDATAAS